MNPTKLEEMDVIPLEEIRRKLEKQHGKLVIASEINEIGEELNIEEFESNLVNNVIQAAKDSVNFLQEIPLL